MKYLEIPDELYEKCEEPMKDYGYSSFTEFAKDAIRDKAIKMKNDD